MKRSIIAAFCLVSCAAVAAPAAELPRYFQGVRPLGMGGAFTAVADDENALFYNPAGLDKVEKWGFALINPLVEVGDEGRQFIDDTRDTDFDVTSEVTDLLREHLGSYLHYRAALFPHFVMEHFAIGVLAQSTVNAQPHNIAFPEMETDAFASVGGHIGFGYGFMDDLIRVGVGGKVLKAYRLAETYTAADIAADDFQDRIDEDLKDDVGFGFDAGAMVEFPVLLKPTLALAVLNITDTDLGEAGELPQQINLGASVSHTISWLTLVGAADWLDVNSQLGLDNDKFKRLHFGVEAQVPVLSVRAGLYQGYAAFGATIDLKLLKIDYANYAEELGSAAGDRDGRRNVLQASLGW